MADQPIPHPEELTSHARQHLASLRAAGIEWLPNGPAPPVSAPAPPASAPVAEKPAPSRLVERPEPAPAKLNNDDRRHELTVLAKRVASCTRCTELASTRTQTVFGVGEPGVELCFVGEAPGADEDARGEPFVGPAGQLLDRIIAACGLKREEVYICNIIKCRPPGNRPPLPNEAAHCREFLERQLELVQPRFICALGATAAQNLLGTTVAIGKLRGSIHDYRGIPVLCTYHPSYLLRTQEPMRTTVKRQVWDDMKRLLARMGRPVPGR